MIQVKEFLNYQEGQDEKINKWLSEQGDNIEIVDIKYSVGSFNSDGEVGSVGQEFSGVLIIYKYYESVFGR